MNFLVKPGNFIFIGWWAAFSWIGLSLVVCLTAIGIPAGFKMLQFTPLTAWLEQRH